MHVLAIYAVIFACLTVLLIIEFKTWGNMESQFLLWLLWTLCWPDLMIKDAACSLIPCLQPLGKSTFTGQPLRLQGLAGEWEGKHLDLYPCALIYSPMKISPTSACQSVRTWEEIIFHCHEKFLSRCRSWTEKWGLERPFKILLRCLVWGTVDSRGPTPKGDFLLDPKDAELTSLHEFISERPPF